MTDYTKYCEIKTKDVTDYKGDFDSTYEAFESRETQVNDALKKLLAEGYEIIDIKYNDIASGDRHSNVYAVGTISYGKRKDTTKK